MTRKLILKVCPLRGKDNLFEKQNRKKRERERIFSQGKHSLHPVEKIVFRFPKEPKKKQMTYAKDIKFK